MLASQPKAVRYGAYLLLFLVGMGGGNALVKWLQSRSEGHVTAQEMVSKRGPDFTLPDLQQVMHSKSEWDGKVLVVNFWATWCPPCQKETPLFVELQSTYGASGLQFVGIGIDTPEKIKEFAETYGVNYPMLYGDEDAVTVAKKYGNRFGALPYTAILNRAGEIVFVQRGELTRDMAESMIRPLL